MSASREKKQRTSDIEALTQRQRKEAKEAQAAKRNKVIYSVVAGVLVILIAALLIWDSGFFQKRGDAVTAGDTTLSVAEMQYYYGLARVQQHSQEMYMQQVYAQMGASYTPTYNIFGSDTEQIKDAATGQTWADFFKDSALQTAQQTVALVSAAKADGVTLSDEAKTQAEEQLKSLKDSVRQSASNFTSYLKSYYGRYLDEGTFRRCALNDALANEYYTAHKDSLTYTDDVLRSYADENAATLHSYDFRYFVFEGTPEAKTDEAGNAIEATEEEIAAAKAAAKTKADTLITALNASTDKATAFDQALLAILPPTAETETNPAATVQAEVLGSELTDNVYYDWLTSTDRKSGDVSEPIESGSNYYVVLFEGAALNEASTENVRHILIRAEAGTDNPETEVDESLSPTQESLDAAKAKAQSVLDEFNAGEKTEDAFAALANKYSEDTGSNTNGGLYPDVEEGDMVPNFNDWLFDSTRKSGDTGIVDNVAEGSSYFGYHVMYYVGQGQQKWAIDATAAKQTADMTVWMEALEAPYTATALPGMDLLLK